MQRRNLVLATASAAMVGIVRAQGASPRLPVAPSADEPYARLQGGASHMAERGATPPKAGACRYARALGVARGLADSRSEMAWATAAAGRMRGRRLRRARSAATTATSTTRRPAGLVPAAARPNRVAVAASRRVYASGGFVEQNRWTASPRDLRRPLVRDRTLPRRAVPRPAVVMDGAIPDGSAEPASERASVNWHGLRRRPTLVAQGAGARGRRLYPQQPNVIGGRFNTFEYSTDPHRILCPRGTPGIAFRCLPRARATAWWSTADATAPGGEAASWSAARRARPRSSAR